MKKHLIACGILSTMFMATSFAQKDIDRPIMGWSSWNTYHVNISEELIKQQADALIKHGLKEAGYNYINIDDGFFGYRDETGKMHPHPDRFPNGMKVVSDYIHSLGLRAGIYSDAGDNTCGSIYDNDANGVGSGLYGHEQQDMDLYIKEWNYDFITIIVADVNWDWMKKNVTTQSARLLPTPEERMYLSTSADGHSPAPGPKNWHVPGVSVRISAPNGILSKGLLKRTYIFLLTLPAGIITIWICSKSDAG